MMRECPTVRLELSSKPECISLVRAMLSGLAEPLGFDAELLDDLKTAVSEACNNVVLHAYPDNEPGPLMVIVELAPDSIEVIVRDWGRGIHQVSPSEDRLHVGLALISALADRSEFLSADGGGAEARIEFHRQLRWPVSGGVAATNGNSADAWRRTLSGDVVVTLAPVGLLAGVLGRLTRALAAGARFTLDRFSDLYLVTDAVAAHAASAARGAEVSFALLAETRRLEMTIGPFDQGTSRQLQDAAADQESLLAVLTDELTVEPTNSSEALRIVLKDKVTAR